MAGNVAKARKKKGDEEVGEAEGQKVRWGETEGFPNANLITGSASPGFFVVSH